MNANCTNRIINLENLVNKFNTKYNNETRCNTDDCCRCRRYCVAACGDCNKTCKRTVQGHGNIRFFVADPCDQHNGYSGNCSSKVGSYKDFTCTDNCISFHGNCGGTVKAEPAEPEDKYAKCTNCQVMTRDSS